MSERRKLHFFLKTYRWGSTRGRHVLDCVYVCSFLPTQEETATKGPACLPRRRTVLYCEEEFDVFATLPKEHKRRQRGKRDRTHCWIDYYANETSLIVGSIIGSKHDMPLIIYYMYGRNKESRSVGWPILSTVLPLAPLPIQCPPDLVSRFASRGNDKVRHACPRLVERWILSVTPNFLFNFYIQLDPDADNQAGKQKVGGHERSEEEKTILLHFRRTNPRRQLPLWDWRRLLLPLPVCECFSCSRHSSSPCNALKG